MPVLPPISTRQCADCLEPFQPKTKHQKFCNDKCRNNYHNYYKNLPVEKPEAEIISAIRCPHCNTDSSTPNLIEQISSNSYLCIVCSKEFSIKKG